MARTTNLLNTSDITLKGLLGNGSRYSVPPYQRDYSWREEHWEDLWQDLDEVAQNTDAQHYMGAVVLQQRDVEDFIVIDGQQRLCTLSLVALAAVALLEDRVSANVEPDANRERAKLLRDGFLGTRDPGSLKYSSKLTLNRNDDSFYQGTLLQLKEPLAPRRLSDSNRQLWDAFRYFKARLSTRYPRPADGPNLARFVNEAVALRLLFIRVLVDDEISAYTVFETLNARGLDLTASDLLKNFLMSQIAKRGDGDLRFVMDQWERIAEAIGVRTVPEFLRHYLNSKQPYIRQERLFKTLKADVVSAEAVFQLLDELEKASIWYQALSDPSDPHWLAYGNASEHVRALNLFGVKQYRPLILAAARKFEATDIEAVLRYCAVVSLRYTVIADRNPSELERAYNDIAIDIHEGRLSGAAQVRQALTPVAVADDEFRDAFTRKSLAPSGRTRKLVRFILCALERQLGHTDIHDDSSSASVEHVLPVSLTDEWQTNFDVEQHARYVNRLGNLSLLDVNRNRDIGQAGYAAKRETYEASGYEITRRIRYEDWKPATIEARQKDMAGWATSIWKL